MPWCEDCSKYWAPTALTPDGKCPTCGRPVGESERKAAEVAEAEATPWHFKLLVVLLVIYLTWRFWQLLT